MPWSYMFKKKHFRLYIYIIIKFVFAKDVFVSKIGLDSFICSLYMYDKRGVYEDMSQAVSYMCTCIQIKLMGFFLILWFSLALIVMHEYICLCCF